MRNRTMIRGMLTGALLLLSAIPGAYGFLSGYDSKNNVISVGNITTEIQEEFPAPTPIPIEENPAFKKKVWVSCADSEGQADCYVRLSLAYSDYDIGQAVILKNLDTENWAYDPEDGYYYYKKMMSAGEKSTSLFTGVQIDSECLGAYDPDVLSMFEISVYQEAVQAEGFSDYKAAWEYYLNASAQG